MKPRLIISLLLSSTLSAALVGCKQGNDVLKAKLVSALGSDVRSYQVLSYPTNNFGVGTTYEPTSSSLASDKDFLCSTWKCLGFESSSNIPKDAHDQLVLHVGSKDFAEVGTGGTITLTDSEAHSFLFNGLLPQIGGILHLSGSLSASNTTDVSLRLGQASKRLLSKPDFLSYIRHVGHPNPTQSQLRAGLAEGALAVVVGDVVFDSIKATITTKSKFGPEIDAKLNSAASKVFANSTLSFKLTKEGNDKYTFETTSPVVVMRLVKKQPAAGVLGATASWSNWTTIKAADPFKH